MSTPDNNIKDIEEALAVEEKKKVEKANLKRYFFTLVVNSKKVLGPKHIAHYTNNMLLFNEATKQNISVDDWPMFIMTQLNTNPSAWIEPKKLYKIQTMYSDYS